MGGMKAWLPAKMRRPLTFRRARDSYVRARGRRLRQVTTHDLREPPN